MKRSEPVALLQHTSIREGEAPAGPGIRKLVIQARREPRPPTTTIGEIVFHLQAAGFHRSSFDATS